MKSNLRLTAMLLLVTTVAGVPAVWALEFPPTAAEQPAGCHDSMPASPSPVPASHQCCAGGHDWAVTVSVLIVHPAVQPLRTIKEFHDPQPHLFSDHLPAFLSVSPPATTSLRI